MIAMRVRAGEGGKSGKRSTAFARLLELGRGERVAEVVMAGAERIRRRWEANVPVRRGHYKSSLYAKPVQVRGHRAVVVVGTDIGAAGGPKGDEGPYPYFLEYGTSKMAAQPSMRPAIDAELGGAAREAEAVLQRQADAAERAA